MSDDTSHPSNLSTAGTLAVLVLLPLLYVFSIGPVGYLTQKFNASPTMGPYLQIFYQPVIWLHDRTPLKQTLEAYVQWWIDLAGP